MRALWGPGVNEPDAVSAHRTHFHPPLGLRTRDKMQISLGAQWPTSFMLRSDGLLSALPRDPDFLQPQWRPSSKPGKTL